MEIRPTVGGPLALTALETWSWTERCICSKVQALFSRLFLLAAQRFLCASAMRYRAPGSRTASNARSVSSYTGCDAATQNGKQFLWPLKPLSFATIAQELDAEVAMPLTWELLAALP